ncbi:FAD binding domain protein [Cooperia oncophora]
MGATARPPPIERLFTWLLYSVRCYAIVVFILPLSFILDLLLTVRNTVVYAIGTAPRAHVRKVAAIQKQVHEWGKGDRKKKMHPVHYNFSKSMLRLPNKDTTLIDTGTLMDILEINREALTIRVEPMITMGELSRVLIPQGYCLPILPGNKDLTVEDAINGRGADVSGRKYGLFQHICLSYELVMPDGSLVTATKDKKGDAETQALFFGVPWSEGTLGIMVAATLRIIPIKPFVKITYLPVRSIEVSPCICRSSHNCCIREIVEA